ncbi:RNA methyltransferase [uncultured Shewanella sp.]|uniref:RNA methyltransferase n=1 Tax=uncultured Shewanella sp. TaxID=173975 RepID=UPI00261503A0|nr:RNA methyltransferase [uncultured Shewanella sp.]
MTEQINTIDSTLEHSRAAIGLVNPKTPVNVGGIMRAAGCYQAKSVLYTGNRYELAARSGEAQYDVDTKNAARTIPLTRVESLLEQAPEGAKIICVDLVVGATPLPLFEHPQNAFYIFGPEDGTIPQQIIDAADDVVYVPTVGCMNLAASVNVLLYDRLSKSAQVAADDELIRESRDNNNRTKVKTWLK